MKIQPIRTILSQRLRQLMDVTPALDTQDKVAERTGLAQSTIGRILNNSNSPTLDKVETIAQAFRLTVGDLLQFNNNVSKIENICKDLPFAEITKIETFAEYVHAQFSENKEKSLNLNLTTDNAKAFAINAKSKTYNAQSLVDTNTPQKKQTTFGSSFRKRK